MGRLGRAPGGEQPYGATGIWATDTTADLYLPLDGPKDVTLRLQLAPLTYAGRAAADASRSASTTCRCSRTSALASGWQDVQARRCRPPPRAAAPTASRLDFAWAESPRQVFPDPASRAVIGRHGRRQPGQPRRPRFRRGVYQRFSAADGSEVKASTDRRGYNVTVIDPRTGKLLETRRLRHRGQPLRGGRLAAYLTGIPAGRIVAVATKGDAGRQPDAGRGGGVCAASAPRVSLPPTWQGRPTR